MNHKKLRRLYREEGLSVRRRRGRKRATGTRSPMILPERPGQITLQASGCDRAEIVPKPRLLSDNGLPYIAGDLAYCL